MPLPKTEREVYEHNPLEEVICQLRFPTILQVTAESPAQFQNAIRDIYPLYREDQPAPGIPTGPGIPKVLADILGGLQFPVVHQHPEHKFLTVDQTRLVSLTRDFIAVTEKKYRRWENFREEIKHAESAFREIYKPSFYSRIGLRYRDVLDRDRLGLEGRAWAELLNPSFIGELGAQSIADEVEDIRTRSVVRLPDVENGRVLIQHGLIKSTDNGRQVYTVDADFYTTQRSELDDAFQILDVFNQWGGRLFRWVITPKLREALGPSRI